MKSAAHSYMSRSQWPARLHLSGQELPSVPLEARIAGQSRRGLEVLLRGPVNAGVGVRVEVDGGQVFGTVLEGEHTSDGFLCIVDVDRVVVVPSGIAMLSTALSKEAGKRAAWAPNPVVA